MSYNTSSLSFALKDLDSMLAELKQGCTNLRNRSNTGLSGDAATQAYAYLKQKKAQITALAAVSGMQQYCKDQKNNQAFDLAAEITAINNAIDTTTTWITNNFPKDGNGFILNHQFTATDVTSRQFSSGSLAGLRTNLDVIIGLIV